MKNKTVLLVTYDAEIARNMDYVAKIENGKLIIDETNVIAIDEAIEKPLQITLD